MALFMKKIVSYLLCLLILSVLFSSSAFAGYSFSQMSEEELVQVAAAVNKEIINRHQSESINLVDGQYTVGHDIPAGEYIIMLSCVDVSLTMSGTARQIDNDSLLILCYTGFANHPI